MRVVQAANYPALPASAAVSSALDISLDWLRNAVEALSYPRHFLKQPHSNRRAAEWIEDQFRSFGYRVQRQGAYYNLVTRPPGNQPVTLVGAHFDSKPETPGADDNASAVVAMLAAARAISAHAPSAPVVFVAFNREEEGLIGSTDFVANFLPDGGLSVEKAHVLEMLGYADARPDTQKVPRGLPIRLLRDQGDFVAILGNRQSKRLVDLVMRTAKSYTPELPALGLKIGCGLENRFAHLRRSDHAPFWDAKIPTVMWTDTAEFRNPHYHQPSDTPETLDYLSLQRVTQLLIATILGK